MKKIKEKKKYVTISEGTDFRRIAEIMTAHDMKMNHATARNQLMLAMENLFSDIAKQMNTKLDKKQLNEMLHNQDVHNALADTLFKAYTSLKEEGKL